MALSPLSNPPVWLRQTALSWNLACGRPEHRTLVTEVIQALYRTNRIFAVLSNAGAWFGEANGIVASYIGIGGCKKTDNWGKP